MVDDGGEGAFLSAPRRTKGEIFKIMGGLLFLSHMMGDTDSHVLSTYSNYSTSSIVI